MANALLFYRTPTTEQGDPGFADPQNLPTAQKLEFIFPADIMEGVNEQYQNNIKQIPIPNQDGSRKLNIQENGLQNYTITLNGVFEKGGSTLGITRLKSFRTRKQVDTAHPFGSFGIEIDNAPEFNVDPSATLGLFIQSTTVGYVGVRTTRYDFSVALGFGGTAV